MHTERLKTIRELLKLYEIHLNYMKKYPHLYSKTAYKNLEESLIKVEKTLYKPNYEGRLDDRQARN